MLSTVWLQTLILPHSYSLFILLVNAFILQSSVKSTMVLII